MLERTVLVAGYPFQYCLPTKGSAMDRAGTLKVQGGTKLAPADGKPWDIAQAQPVVLA